MLQTRKAPTTDLPDLPSSRPAAPRPRLAAAVASLACVTLSALATACGGGTEFGGDNRKSADAQLAGTPTPGADGNQTPGPGTDDGVTGGQGDDDTGAIVNLSDLTWFFQCDAAPAPVPTPASADSAVIVGAGPHRFAKGTLDHAPVTFAGALCPPAQVARDVDFVIDTSD
jgi:hypothetical protein